MNYIHCNILEVIDSCAKEWISHKSIVALLFYNMYDTCRWERKRCQLQCWKLVEHFLCQIYFIPGYNHTSDTIKIYVFTNWKEYLIFDKIPVEKKMNNKIRMWNGKLEHIRRNQLSNVSNWCLTYATRHHKDNNAINIIQWFPVSFRNVWQDFRCQVQPQTTKSWLRKTKQILLGLDNIMNHFSMKSIIKIRQYSPWNVFTVLCDISCY